MPTNYSHALPRSAPNLVNYFLPNLFMKNIGWLVCHRNILFAREKIRYMGIYIPRNFIPKAKHVVMIEAIECLETNMTTCICLAFACRK